MILKILKFIVFVLYYMIKMKIIMKLVESNYFLFGGFDTDLIKGKIILYKINYGENVDNTTIEYEQLN